MYVYTDSCHRAGLLSFNGSYYLWDFKVNFEECLIAYHYLSNNYIFPTFSRSKQKFLLVSFLRHLLEKKNVEDHEWNCRSTTEPNVQRSVPAIFCHRDSRTICRLFIYLLYDAINIFKHLLGCYLIKLEFWSYSPISILIGNYNKLPIFI